MYKNINELNDRHNIPRRTDSPHGVLFLVQIIRLSASTSNPANVRSRPKKDEHTYFYFLLVCGALWPMFSSTS